jgi:hypothetical protein
MGLFAKQSIRLLRERWNDATELAEEIYAILNNDEPLQIDGPVTINNNTSGPGITINNGGPGNTGGIQINRQPDPGINFPDLPPVPPTTAPVVTIIYNGGNVTSGPDPNGQQPVGGGGGGGCFPGKILSGSGDTYSVAVYESGLAGEPKTRVVKQLQIDPAETIQENTWVMVGKVGNSFFMMVPVWL